MKKATKDAIKAERLIMKNISFDADITAFNQQQGMGKSTNAQNYSNEHPEKNIAILTKRHNFLTKCETKIKGFTHWKGLGILCTHPRKKYFEDLKLLSAAYRCGSCPKKKTNCKYHEQFKNTHRIGAPTDYLNFNDFKDFDTIFVEEKITEIDTYWYKPSDISEGGYAIISKFTNNYTIEVGAKSPLGDDYPLYEFVIALESNDFKTLEKYINAVENLQTKALIEAIKDGEIDLIKEIKKLDIPTLRGYLKHGRKYNYHKPVYYAPRIFKLFDLARAGKKIALLHAGFYEPLFKDLLARYENEFPWKRNLTFTVHPSHVENKCTKCIRLTTTGFGRTGLGEKQNNLILPLVIEYL